MESDKFKQQLEDILKNDITIPEEEFSEMVRKLKTMRFISSEIEFSILENQREFLINSFCEVVGNSFIGYFGGVV